MKKIQLLIILSALACSREMFSQEPDTSLSDGPQTLGTESQESAPPATESIPAPSAPPAAEEVKDLSSDVSETPKSEEPPSAAVEDTTPTKAQGKTKKSEVVSEEDLLKTKAQKEGKKDSKVRSEKVSESELYIQEADKFKIAETYKNLQLNDVIEQGLRKNFDQDLRTKQQKVNEVVYSGVKDAFWLPQLKLELVTTPQHISTIRTGSRAANASIPNTPTGALGLSLGDYTVFNWGKDYALYLNKKSTYERSSGALDESRRELKLDLIAQYFSLVATNSVEKIRQDQLRQASFVYRLNKEKITIGKTSKQDYYQARSEYLKAQNDFHEAKINNDLNHEQMAYLIADEAGTKYVLNEALDYKRIKITLEDAIVNAKKNNPTILSNKTRIENAERSYDVALKENLPLPKFTMNLGAYTKRFGPTTNQTTYETYGGTGRIDLVASINASWSLTGEDGFLNSNKLALGRMEREIALKDFEKNTFLTQSLIRQAYKNILALQNQIIILEARIPTLQKTFDTILDNYLNNKTKYYDVHIALNELTESKVLYEQYKLDHLKEKLILAKLAGLEDFPGENFEQLAVRVKGK